jgi:hypothetical protein
MRQRGRFKGCGVGKCLPGHVINCLIDGIIRTSRSGPNIVDNGPERIERQSIGSAAGQASWDGLSGRTEDFGGPGERLGNGSPLCKTARPDSAFEVKSMKQGSWRSGGNMDHRQGDMPGIASLPNASMRDPVERLLASLGRLVVLVALGVTLVGLRPAQAFDCPHPDAQTNQDALRETRQQVKEISGLLASGDVGNRIGEIAHDLRQKYPGLTDAELVNYFLTAYCPDVAAMGNMSDKEKKARLDEFSGQVFQALEQ